MIRAETPTGWILITHQDHARLAGFFASAWGNKRFEAPGPREAVNAAVARHDDGWVARDAHPVITPEGRPSAFTKELVGTYAAFEEVGIEDYLRVRGEATEAVARDSAYSAILVSMHTCNLLTQQMDVSTLSPRSRELHGAFVEGQRRRQAELAESLRDDPVFRPVLGAASLDRAFKFLQACDNLSLLACAAYPNASKLRHRHPDVDNQMVEFSCEPRTPPAGFDVAFAVLPSPFGKTPLEFEIPCRVVEGKVFASSAALEEKFHAAPISKIRGVILA